MSNLSIKQYSYLYVSSKVLTSQDIEAKLGRKADKHSIWGKGRLRMDPNFKVTYAWELVADDNVPVDTQIEELVKRILPVEDQLLDLLTDSDVEVGISVVRHFDDPRGEAEIIDETEDLIKLPGQHQLLGFHINSEIIQFLHETHAEIDVDEYN